MTVLVDALQRIEHARILKIEVSKSMKLLSYFMVIGWIDRRLANAPFLKEIIEVPFVVPPSG
jgi:hypothetical protein